MSKAREITHRLYVYQTTADDNSMTLSFVLLGSSSIGINLERVTIGLQSPAPAPLDPWRGKAELTGLLVSADSISLANSQKG